MMGDGGDWWWVLMWLLMLAFWAFVIGAVAWLLVRSSDGGSSDSRELLDRRLAAGEITVEQHRTLSAELHPARRARAPRFLSIALIVAALVALFAMAPMWAMAAGNWDMWGHMWNMHGGGRDTSGATLTIGGEAGDVIIDDFTFSPGNLQVPVGATVTWVNGDSAPHDATARDGSWSTGTLSEDESTTLTFNDAGTYEYRCTIHPSMKARLTVR